jgi:hypothetical protein
MPETCLADGSAAESMIGRRARAGQPPARSFFLSEVAGGLGVPDSPVERLTRWIEAILWNGVQGKGVPGGGRPPVVGCYRCGVGSAGAEGGRH